MITISKKLKFLLTLALLISNSNHVSNANLVPNSFDNRPLQANDSWWEIVKSFFGVKKQTTTSQNSEDIVRQSEISSVSDMETVINIKEDDHDINNSNKNHQELSSKNNNDTNIEELSAHKISSSNKDFGQRDLNDKTSASFINLQDNNLPKVDDSYIGSDYKNIDLPDSLQDIINDNTSESKGNTIIKDPSYKIDNELAQHTVSQSIESNSNKQYTPIQHDTIVKNRDLLKLSKQQTAQFSNQDGNTQSPSEDISNNKLDDLPNNNQDNYVKQSTIDKYQTDDLNKSDEDQLSTSSTFDNLDLKHESTNSTSSVLDINASALESIGTPVQTIRDNLNYDSKDYTQKTISDTKDINPVNDTDKSRIVNINDNNINITNTKERTDIAAEKIYNADSNQILQQEPDNQNSQKIIKINTDVTNSNSNTQSNDNASTVGMIVQDSSDNTSLPNINENQSIDELKTESKDITIVLGQEDNDITQPNTNITEELNSPNITTQSSSPTDIYTKELQAHDDLLSSQDDKTLEIELFKSRAIDAFISQELANLANQGDEDVVLGSLTEDAKLILMNDLDYIKLIEQKLEYQNEDKKLEEVQNIMNYHLAKTRKYKGKINNQMIKRQALDHACHSIEKNEINNLRTILDYYHIINFLDEDGKSLLHTAAKYNNYNLSKLLIFKGSSIDVSDYYGFTPLGIAITNNNKNLLNLFYNLKLAQ